MCLTYRQRVANEGPDVWPTGLNDTIDSTVEHLSTEAIVSGLKYWKLESWRICERGIGLR